MSRPVIVCAACGHTREHRAHGWCQPCYRRWCYWGQPAGGPPPVRLLTHDDVQGTVKGWDLHKRRGTPSCEPCRVAHREDMRARYGGRKVPLEPCGTEAAFQRHHRQGEPPCPPCRDAYNAAQRGRYATAPYQLNKRRHYTEAASHWEPEQEKVALAAASRAADPEDCRLLLEALGLVPSSAPRRERARGAA